jgi:hypothetical protein
MGMDGWGGPCGVWEMMGRRLEFSCYERLFFLTHFCFVGRFKFIAMIDEDGDIHSYVAMALHVE